MIIVYALFLLIFLVAVFFIIQLLLGLKSEALTNENTEERGRCAILVPAHNEQAGIEKTIASAKAQMQEGDIILVVADNCSDDTATVSRSAGALCIERQNKEFVGKGHALQYGIDHIKSLDEQFDTVVVMDADCLFAENSLDRLLHASIKQDCVAQALYLMKSPNKDNIKLNISEFTWLIKNWVRPLGQKKLGISCHLQGSGMAFPMRVLNNYSLASSSIVEDLELGLNIVKGGDKIAFVENAVVNSYFPENEEGLDIQRKRWEHGHLSVVANMPKTMFNALLKLNFKLFFQALDAAIPPTIMWIAVLVLTWVTTFVFGIFYGFQWTLMYTLILWLLATSLFLCWYFYATAILSVSQLKGLVPFILGKFSVYRSFVSNREKTWVRTKRDDE